MSLPSVSVFLAVSLDGLIARDDDSLDWLTIGPPDPPETTGYTALMERTDTMIVGRRTYDTVLSFPEWPFARKRVVVLTNRPLENSHGESAYAGPLRALLQDLWGAGSRQVYLDGGLAVRQGLAAGVVTELTLTVAPIILGRGRPLFDHTMLDNTVLDNIVPETRWALRESRVLASGMVQLSYLPG